VRGRREEKERKREERRERSDSSWKKAVEANSELRLWYTLLVLLSIQ
jgi:hypothetical protein